MVLQLRISKQGENALTATNPNDFIFHSAFNTFKIIAEGSLISQTVNADPKTFTVAHGQSGVPGIYAFIKFPDGFVTLPGGKERADVVPRDRYWDVEVDSTNIYFICHKGGSANYNVDIKYYIFEVPI